MSVPVRVVVPLKSRSERLPGKNVRLLGGRPLYHWCVETALQLDEVEEIHILASTSEFHDLRSQEWSRVSWKRRPEYLDSDRASITDVLRFYCDLTGDGLVVLLHATSPFLSPETIQEAVEGVSSGRADSALAVQRVHKFASYKGQPVNFDEWSALPRTQDLAAIELEQGGLYVFDSNDLLMTGRRVGTHPHRVVVSGCEAVDIDDLFDFQVASGLVEAGYVKPPWAR